MNNLERRLRYLRNLELLNAGLMPFCFTLLWKNELLWRSGVTVSWWVRLGAVMFVSFLLVQGGIYWHLKLQALRNRTYLSARAVRIFQLLRVLNPLILLLGVSGITAAALARFATGADLIWGYFLLLFAGLEYINYFFIQLSHDNLKDIRYLLRFRRLRKAPLASDIERVQRRRE